MVCHQSNSHIVGEFINQFFITPAHRTSHITIAHTYTVAHTLTRFLRLLRRAIIYYIIFGIFSSLNIQIKLNAHTSFVPSRAVATVMNCVGNVPNLIDCWWVGLESYACQLTTFHPFWQWEKRLRFSLWKPVHCNMVALFMAVALFKSKCFDSKHYKHNFGALRLVEETIGFHFSFRLLEMKSFGALLSCKETQISELKKRRIFW